jgi:hypothetical protein
LWPRASALTWHLIAELRGDDDIPSAGSEESAEQLLALAVRVHIGGVEEVDSDSNRGVYYLSRASVIDASTEIVATDTDDRYAERSDLSRFHSPP